MLMITSACYTAAPLDERALLANMQAPGRLEPTRTPASRWPMAPLTEQDAVRLAMEQNRTIHAARTEVSVASGEVRTAQQLNNPEARIDGDWEGHRRLQPDQVQVAARWSPPRFPEYVDGIRAAEAAVPVAQATVAQVQWDVRQLVRLAWSRAVFASLKAQVLSQFTKVSTEHAQRMRQSALEGLYDPLLAMKDAMTKEKAWLETQEARAAQRGALQELATLVGRPDVEEAAVVYPREPPECRAPPSPALVNTLEDRLLNRHPALQVRRAAYEQAEAELRAEHSKGYPWLKFVQMGYNFNRDPNKAGVNVGLAVDLPLMDFNLGGVETGKARRLRERTLFSEQLAHAMGLLHATVSAWRDAHARHDRLQRDLLPLARKTVETATEAAKAGRMADVEVMKIRLDQLKVETSALDAALACREAAINAEHASGIPLEQW